MYIKRSIEKTILDMNKQFKVLLITGARQVGKSTVLKKCDESRTYVTLDDPNLRELANTDPSLFLQRFTPPLIIDEIQYAPGLLPYIKMIADNTDQKGLYWLTGSQQFSMMRDVSESLAGRIGILNLMGFSLRETDGNITDVPFLPTNVNINTMRANSKPHNLKETYEIIWRGSYPEINKNESMNWNAFYSSYVQTYLERDIRNLATISDELSFLKFIKVIASRTGQVLNYSDISKDVGISQPTVKAWLSLLISSGIVHLLQPYYNNVNQRLIKTPKLYFSDTGLCSYLTGWNNPEVLESGAMSGSIFETFVVNEIIKSYKHNGFAPKIYYYRDKDKKEIDLIIEDNNLLYLIEIKKTSKPDKETIKNFSVIEEDKFTNGAVICMAQSDLPMNSKTNIIPYWYI